MTYVSEEALRHGLVHLYDFARGATVWRYTDAPADVSVGGVTYRAAAIERGGLSRTMEGAHGELVLHLALETPLAADLLAGGLTRVPLTVRVRAQHLASTGAIGATPAAPAVLFVGAVKRRVVDDGAGRCTLHVASLLATLERPILTVITSATCNNAVYGEHCGVNIADFSTAGTVAAIDGRTVTVAAASAQASGYYTAGLLIAEGRRYFIERHAGDKLRLTETPAATLTVGDACTIAAGCDGLRSTCHFRFNNVRHFRGFPLVPRVNPFDDLRAR